MLPVVWALQKCRLYLSATKFEIVTDHRLLVPILNSYSLDQVENPRLLRLRLKVQSFWFHVSWRKGTKNVFADALSRNPVDIPTPEEEFVESPALSCRTLRVCLQSQETQSPPVNLRFKFLRERQQLSTRITSSSSSSSDLVFHRPCAIYQHPSEPTGTVVSASACTVAL